MIAAGNLLYDGTHYYFYDAENHLIQVDGTLGYCTAGTGTAATACYVYDAEGHRVHRTGVITDTCDGTGKRDYVFDLAGNWVGEYSSNGNGCKSEIYAGSRHLVTYAGVPLFSFIPIGSAPSAFATTPPPPLTTSRPAPAFPSATASPARAAAKAPSTSPAKNAITNPASTTSAPASTLQVSVASCPPTH